MLLCVVRVLKPVWIGHVDKGRVVFHHFSHTSIKQKLCNLQKSMEQFMPLPLFVFTSVRLRFKWSVQTKLYQEISFSHAFMSSPVKRLVAGKRLVQHLAGWQRWLRVRWQSLQNHCSWWRWWSEKSADLRILFILLWNIRRDVTKIEHSKHFCNLCCEFMVCIHVQYCAVTFKLGALTKPI